MIRCIHLWTGDDQQSHFEEGRIALDPGQRGDLLTGKLATASVSFEETKSGGASAWHKALCRKRRKPLAPLTAVHAPNAPAQNCPWVASGARNLTTRSAHAPPPKHRRASPSRGYRAPRRAYVAA